MAGGDDDDDDKHQKIRRSSRLSTGKALAVQGDKRGSGKSKEEIEIEMEEQKSDDSEGSSEVEKSESIEPADHSEDDDGGSQSNRDFESDSADSRSRTGVCSFQSQFNMGNLLKVICCLTPDQRGLVEACGFGSILHLKCKNIPYKEFLVTLAKHYDDKTKSIKIPGTHSFKIDRRIVQSILDIPCGSTKINRTAKRSVKEFIGQQTTPGKLAPKIDDLIAMIKPDVLGDRFVRIFLMVVLAIFLCPSTSSRASCHYYNGLRSVKDIKSFDWCAAVAECLNTGLSKFKSSRNKRSPTLSGCLFVLYTAFFDFLGSDAGIVPQTTPRIGVWTDDNVDKYLAKYPLCDKIEIKSIESTVFGNVSLKRKRTISSHVHARNESAAFQQNLGGSSSQHNTPKKMKKIVEDHSSPLIAATVPVSKDSVKAAFPGCTDSQLRIFSGEDLHPQIEMYINSLAGSHCSNEVLVALRKACLSFFREKFLEYIENAEGVLISHCLSLVKCFITGVQFAPSLKVSGASGHDASPSNIPVFGHGSVRKSDSSVGGSSNAKGYSVHTSSFDKSGMHGSKQKDKLDENSLNTFGEYENDGGIVQSPALEECSTEKNIRDCHAGNEKKKDDAAGGRKKVLPSSHTQASSNSQIPSNKDCPSTSKKSDSVGNIQMEDNGFADNEEKKDDAETGGRKNVLPSGHTEASSNPEVHAIKDCPPTDKKSDSAANVQMEDDGGSAATATESIFLVVNEVLSSSGAADNQKLANDKTKKGAVTNAMSCKTANDIPQKDTDDNDPSTDGQGHNIQMCGTDKGVSVSSLQKEDDASGVGEKHNQTSENNKTTSAALHKEKDDASGDAKMDIQTSDKCKTSSAPSYEKQECAETVFVVDDLGAVHIGNEETSSVLSAKVGPHVNDAEDAKNACAQRKKELSALGHKKRALKQPSSSFTDANVSIAYSQVRAASAFDKDLYFIGTRRPKGNQESVVCAEIGRMHIDQGTFSQTMGSGKWVGTFAMDLYCEALNYDMINSIHVQVKKGYLTSAEMEYVKLSNVDTNLLVKKLDSEILGFNVTKMDMVFMPILSEKHWWLVVANIRDNRFDILSSLRVGMRETEIVGTIVANFSKAVDVMMRDEVDLIDFENFRRPIHNVPQQRTNDDCGIFVMYYMSTWEGRAIPPIRDQDVYELRVKYAVYLLTHKANTRKLPEIEKKLDGKIKRGKKTATNPVLKKKKTESI